MKWKIMSASVAVLFASSCASLQQAPLIYSSKASVGLDVSSSTTESPGGSISFGVKIVDAAYVPVAVSKKIGFGDADINPQITNIGADYGSGGTSETAAHLEVEAEIRARALADATAEEIEKKEKLDARKAETKKLLDEIKQNEDALAALKKKLSELSASPDGIAINKDGISEIKSSIENLEKINEKKAGQVKVYESEIIVLDLNHRQSVLAVQNAFNAAKKAADLAQVNKRDAMSVYGRFDSNGSSKDASLGVGLTAGKIFSTGVASQNLTEAARYSSLYEGIASCVREFSALYNGLSPEQKVKALEVIERVCNQDAIKMIESRSR